jgi:uncharacterized membrane protein required for colicin V production
MTVLDIILLIVLAGFVFYGLFFGLIKTIGSLMGVIVGAWGASHLYLLFFSIIQDLFFGLDNLGKVVCFIVLFSIINRLVAFGFALLDKTFRLFSIIPFLKTINRLGGAVLGFIEGGLVLGLFLYIVSKYTFVGTFFGDLITESQLAPFLLSFVKIILPLFPQVLKEIRSVL